MSEFEVAGASLATEPPEPALEDRGFEYARAFQNRVIEWIHDGTDPVSVVRAPTGGGKTATFYELIDSRDDASRLSHERASPAATGAV